MPQPPPKLFDRLRSACRVRHLSLRTEDAYHDWCRRFILYHGKRHPREMAEPEVNAFLTHPAVDGHVSAGDPRPGEERRHHLSEQAIQKAVKRAASATGVVKAVAPHTFRHAFATHLIEDGYDIRTVQELAGHASVETTRISTHVLNQGGRGVRSRRTGCEGVGGGLPG